jgi:hypothetical protein
MSGLNFGGIDFFVIFLNNFLSILCCWMMEDSSFYMLASDRIVIIVIQRMIGYNTWKKVFTVGRFWNMNIFKSGIMYVYKNSDQREIESIFRNKLKNICSLRSRYSHTDMFFLKRAASKSSSNACRPITFSIIKSLLREKSERFFQHPE